MKNLLESRNEDKVDFGNTLLPKFSIMLGKSFIPPEKMLALKPLHCIDEERGNISNDSSATGNDGIGDNDNDADEEKDEEDEEENEEKEEGLHKSLTSFPKARFELK